MKIFIFLLIISTAASGNTIMLHKFVSAGPFGPNANSVKDCKLFKNGLIQITFEEGTGGTRNFRDHLPIWKNFLIQNLLKEAQKAKIDNIDSSCESGDTIIHGYVKNKEFILEVDVACGEHRINRSKQTRMLKNMAKRICHF